MPDDSPATLSGKPSEADGAERLKRLEELARELGTRHVAGEAHDLSVRVSEGRFFVACIGQFKRGKSTLINALTGEPVLPSGFLPVTTVPTVVRFGNESKARIRRHNGDWREIPPADLSRYVSEEYNPENTKGIAGVEVFMPAPLLSDGMCLVDTPGLGSVFAGNAASTQDFLPRIDAGLVVMGADPPLAGEELKLVETLGKQVPELILVLNKADRTTHAERAAAVEFTLRLLEKGLGRYVGPVFEVSAWERLQGRGPERDWSKLTRALERLTLDSSFRLVREACERGVKLLSEQLLAIVTEERETLCRPVAESEQRVTTIKITIASAQRSLRELEFLFMAEQQRLSDLFVGRRKDFVRSTIPLATRKLERALNELSRGMAPSYRRQVMRETQGVVRELVLPWLQTEQADAEKEYRQSAQRFVQIGNDYLKKLGETGGEELARMPQALDEGMGFQVQSRFVFRDLIEVAEPASPLRWLGDLLLGTVRAYRIIDRSAIEFLVHLLEINSARVQSDILNRIQESRNRLETDIRKLLHEVTRIAEVALAHARAAQEAGAPAVERARERLDHLEEEIWAVKQTG